MDNKAIVKHFYEVIVSGNLLQELFHYIAASCVFRVRDKAVPLGSDGMKQHLTAVKTTYPDYTMKSSASLLTVIMLSLNSSWKAHLRENGWESSQHINVWPLQALILTR